MTRGGFVIQKYLEDSDAAGAVLLSSPPLAGLVGKIFRIARRRPLAFEESTSQREWSDYWLSCENQSHAA